MKKRQRLMSDLKPFLTPSPDGYHLAIHLTPRSKRNAFGTLYHDAKGKAHLRAFVRTVPEDGKANQALIELVAETMNIPKSSITLLSGHHHRNKVLKIQAAFKDNLSQFCNILFKRSKSSARDRSLSFSSSIFLTACIMVV